MRDQSVSDAAKTAAKAGDDAKQVIVYSTNWCAYCKMAKRYLTGKNVPVVEKNIEEDSAAHKELMDKIGGNFRGVPVIDIAGTIILGFDRAKIDAALKAMAA